MTQSRLIALVTCAFLFVLCALPAQAEVYRLHWVASTIGNAAAGHPIDLDFSYNTDNNEIRWIATFRDNGGLLPNAFKFAVNGTGANPKGHDGELAFFYYDATDMANPKLTVYAYNGVNVSGPGGSWRDGSNQTGIQPPDPILSSLSTNPAFNGGFVKQFIAEDLPGNQRRLGFVIDSTVVQNHVPLYPGDLSNGEVWQGARWASVIGIWFHPMANASFSYAADNATGPAFQQGFISAFSTGTMGWVDTANQKTVIEDPVCESINVSADQVEHGTKVTAEVIAVDPQGDDLTISYTGLPASAMITPAAGTYSSPLPTVTFMWTPTIAEAGTTASVGVVVTDPYGASVTCPFEVEVLPNKTPVCDAGGVTPSYQNLACSSAGLELQLDGSGSTDPNGDPLSYIWMSDCPNVLFDDPTKVNPIINFSAENLDGTPVSCQVMLAISDGYASSECAAPVTVTGCEKDCLGEINGVATFDVCGECAGPGTSCLDCAGTPFGTQTVDRCGQCGGDGLSCIQCKDADLSSNLLILDGGTAALSNIAQKLKSRIRKVRRRDKTSTALVQDAIKLHQAAWASINQVPTVVNQCAEADAAFCTTVSHEDAIKTYTSASSDLVKVIEELGARAKKLFRRAGLRGRKLTKKYQPLVDKAQAQNDVNQLEASGLPTNTFSCATSQQQ